MSDHAAPSCFTTRPGDLHSFGGQSAIHMKIVRGQESERPAVWRFSGSSRRSPVVDVVVFTSPAPVVVGEAIDLQVLLLAHGRNASKVLVVRKSAWIKRHVVNTGQRPPGDNVSSWPLFYKCTKKERPWARNAIPPPEFWIKTTKLLLYIQSGSSRPLSWATILSHPSLPAVHTLLLIWGVKDYL